MDEVTRKMHIKNKYTPNKFADDQTLLERSQKSLQKQVKNVNDTVKAFGMKINSSKTKVIDF